MTNAFSVLGTTVSRSCWCTSAEIKTVGEKIIAQEKRHNNDGMKYERQVADNHFISKG